MKHRIVSPTCLVVLSLSMTVAAGRVANAQYGGLPTGVIFKSPRDAARSDERTYIGPPGGSRADAGMADAYDPAVWRSKQQAARPRRWSSPSRRSGSAAVVPSSYNSRMQPPRMPRDGATYYISGPEADGGDVLQPSAEVPPGASFDTPLYEHPGGPHGHGGCESCGHGHECSSCDHGHEHQPCIQGCCVPCILPEHCQVFAGVHGFKGPRDFGANGNFGFQEGFNLSGPLPLSQCWDLGYQVGWQAVQSNLSGTIYSDIANAALPDQDTRHQYFLTAGLFHRCDVGLQYGVVWDWMREEYIGQLDLNQVRGEISIINPYGREIGFWGAVNTNDDTATFFINDGVPTQTMLEYRGTDQFVFFYRWRFDCSGTARLWGGFSGSGDGILGGDAQVPLNDSFSLAVGANYLIPKESSGPEGDTNEQWNLGINLVWHWRCKARSSLHSHYRPMFSVADNGSFFVEPTGN